MNSAESKKIILLSTLLFLTLRMTSHSFSQIIVDSSLVRRKITSIQIHGNEKTKAPVILREMKLSVGDSLDPHKLEQDQKRIQNLNLFNRVIILAEPEGKDVRLMVLVTEKWYLFPYPIFFINERDWSKLSYGAGLTHLNFRGRAETFSFLFWLGYNPIIRLDYTNPWVGGKRNLLTQVSFYYQRVQNKHFENDKVNENHLGFQWTLGKRFGYHTFIAFSLSYKEISFSRFVPGQTLSPSGKDKFPFFNFSLSCDHRDLKEYPHSGWIVSFNARKNGLPSLTVNYLRYSFDIRKYFPLSKGMTLALRTKTDLSCGKIPIYDRVFLGYSERIRGHFFQKFEGENLALASVAFRIPLLPVHYFELYDMPELRDLKFGMSLGLFADTGFTWFRKEPIKTSLLQSGFGFGLHFHLPYINLLRIELAFNEEGREQLIADLNVDI